VSSQPPNPSKPPASEFHFERFDVKMNFPPSQTAASRPFISTPRLSLRLSAALRRSRRRNPVIYRLLSICSRAPSRRLDSFYSVYVISCNYFSPCALLLHSCQLYHFHVCHCAIIKMLNKSAHERKNLRASFTFYFTFFAQER
jgi:hypothetical protein